MTTAVTPRRLSVSEFYMGRDLQYPVELTPEKQAAALVTVARVNLLLDELALAGIDVETNPRTKTVITSGWRPASVNGTTAGAAPRSKHMLCQACDLYDPEGEIDGWLMENFPVLEKIGLWVEHPSATKGWAHVQTVPPKSGRRVFYP